MITCLLLCMLKLLIVVCFRMPDILLRSMYNITTLDFKSSMGLRKGFRGSSIESRMPISPSPPQCKSTCILSLKCDNMLTNAAYFRRICCEIILFVFVCLMIFFKRSLYKNMTTLDFKSSMGLRNGFRDPSVESRTPMSRSPHVMK